MTVMSDAFTKASPCTCGFNFTDAERGFMREGIGGAAVRVLSRNGKVSAKEFKRLMLQELGAMPLFDKLLESWRGDQSSRDTHASVVAPSTSPRTEPEGHGTRDTHIGHAPPARGQPSVPPTGGDSTEGAHSVGGTHTSRGPSVLSKTPPRPKPPVREPDDLQRRIRAETRNKTAETLEKALYGLKMETVSDRPIDIAEMPPVGSASWKHMLAKAERTGTRGLSEAQTMRECELLAQTLPDGRKPRTLSDQLSRSEVAQALAAAKAHLAGPRVAVPIELIGEAFAGAP